MEVHNYEEALNFLDEKMCEMGINKTELGRRMGYQRSTVCGWFQRRRVMSIDQLISALDVVGYTVNVIGR